MTFEIELGSRTRSVSVKRGSRADHYSVTIDGRPVEVVARRMGELALVVSSEADSQQRGDVPADKTNGGNDFGKHRSARPVFLLPVGQPGEMLVTLEGRTATVRLNGRRPRSSDTIAHAPGDQSVTAPMPGRVVRVLVATGDEVAAGQGVVVVEAMKMENELRAPKTGRVKDVNVAAGTSVDAGKVLVVIE
jgi:biotin carboxyl carrier protein